MGLAGVAVTAVSANRLKGRPSTTSPHTSRNPTGSGHSHDLLTMSFKALGEAEGSGALVAAMSAAPKQVATLTACCTVVAMQAWGNGLCKRGILHADGAPAILSAMRAHREQIAVQETGLMALARVQYVGSTMAALQCPWRRPPAIAFGPIASHSAKFLHSGARPPGLRR